MDCSEIRTFLESVLQRRLLFNLIDENQNQTTIREGIFLNYKIKLPFVFFKLNIKGKVRDVYYPFPFNYEIGENNICFDYQFEKLSFKDENILDGIYKLSYNADNKSKLYDKVLRLDFE